MLVKQLFLIIAVARFGFAFQQDYGPACEGTGPCTCVCGGPGAQCDSENTFSHGVEGTTCNTDAGSTCQLETGICQAPAPQPSARKRNLPPAYPYKQYKYKPRSAVKRAGRHLFK
ncbi:hypothetical protein IAR55_005988 [Kwoniella newhampshirensis]|uniref:Uncharacterized protein n=1 Tax=Kwoniella newhampshirensis TaxID=1651941 RepID=A0AAW0YUI8_9TREE